MRLYLDDDSVDHVLVRLLRQAGHDVALPADLGIAGAEDPTHLQHAIRNRRVLLTRDHDDFRLLHELLMEGQGHHPGILVVRQESKPKRNMKQHDIVRAIGKLSAAGVPIADQYTILNHWR